MRHFGQEGGLRALGEGLFSRLIRRLDHLDGGQHRVLRDIGLELKAREEARAEPPQDGVLFRRRQQDVLVGNIRDRFDGRQGMIELRHPNLALDGGHAILTSLLGPFQRGDGAAEQQKGFRHIPFGRLEAPFVLAAGLGEQRADIFLEHGECRVRYPGIQVGDLRHQDGGAPGWLKIGDVLRGHEPAFLDQADKSARMDAPCSICIDTQGPDVIQPVQQFDHVGGRWRFRAVPQPGESRLADVRIVREQAIQRLPVSVSEATGESLESTPAGAHARLKADALQHIGPWKHDACKLQLVQYGAHDRLTAFRGPRGFAPDPKAIPPGGETEAPELKESLKFGRMFAAGLVTGRILGKCVRRQPKLLGDKADQRLWWVFARSKTLAGVAQQAKLDGKAKPVRSTAFRPNENQVIGGEDVMSRHLAALDWNGEQAIALLGGQKGSNGQNGLAAEKEGRS